MARYRLKLESLKYISAVDMPAQETATAILLKRAGGALPGVQVKAKVVKLAEELGVVFGWALTSKSNGEDYFDLHGDNILEADLIKVALEYVKSGAQTDSMHNREKDGWSPFVMPMTAEMVKSCLGVESPTSGLLIGMQPSAEVFAKFKSGELAGFSIDGTGYREEVAETTKAARVQKHALYTDVVDGHQHVICVYDNGEMWVQSATSEGADNSHSHGIVRGADGSLEILLDSGHTHVLAADQPQLVIVAPDAVVVVQASAASVRAPQPTSKSTHAPQPAKVNTMSNEKALETQLADLQKSNARLTSIAKMTGPQKTHFDTLTGDAQDEFLAKSSTDRDAVIKAVNDGDPVEVEFNGQSYRKSMGSHVIELAKTAKAQAESIEKAEIRSIAKSTLGALAGGDDTHDFIVRAIRKSGGTDEQKTAALKAFEGWNALALEKRKAPGQGGNGDPIDKSAQDAWDSAVVKHMADHKVDKAKATTALMDTPEGARLYGEVAKAIRSKK